MSIATLGGLLLILGSYFVYRGDIFKSIIVYFIVDICWVIISLSAGDILGSAMICVGMTLGILAYYKMNTGRMRRTLEN